MKTVLKECTPTALAIFSIGTFLGITTSMSIFGPQEALKRFYNNWHYIVTIFIVTFVLGCIVYAKKWVREG